MTHVFLSYQHHYEETVVALRDALQSNGFKTWFDLDDMVGSTLESMATAVEEAAVVIICMSSSYKESKNCQKEVEYAERLHKPIIPIRVETGFRPDGWLGLASGSKMVIDFSDPEKYDVKFEQLLKELAAKGVEPNAIDIDEYGTECSQEGEGDDEEESGEYDSEDSESYGLCCVFVCCACSKKPATISPDYNDDQY